MESGKFKPSVKPCPNGMYKVNVWVGSNGNQKGKVVMCDIINKTHAKLYHPVKLDPTWKPIPFKKSIWFSKVEKIENIKFYNPI